MNQPGNHEGGSEGQGTDGGAWGDAYQNNVPPFNDEAYQKKLEEMAQRPQSEDAQGVELGFADAQKFDPLSNEEMAKNETNMGVNARGQEYERNFSTFDRNPRMGAKIDSKTGEVTPAETPQEYGSRLRWMNQWQKYMNENPQNPGESPADYTERLKSLGAIASLDEFRAKEAGEAEQPEAESDHRRLSRDELRQIIREHPRKEGENTFDYAQRIYDETGIQIGDHINKGDKQPVNAVESEKTDTAEQNDTTEETEQPVAERADDAAAKAEQERRRAEELEKMRMEAIAALGSKRFEERLQALGYGDRAALRGMTLEQANALLDQFLEEDRIKEEEQKQRDELMAKLTDPLTVGRTIAESGARTRDELDNLSLDSLKKLAIRVLGKDAVKEEEPAAETTAEKTENQKEIEALMEAYTGMYKQMTEMMKQMNAMMEQMNAMQERIQQLMSGEGNNESFTEQQRREHLFRLSRFNNEQDAKDTPQAPIAAEAAAAATTEATAEDTAEAATDEEPEEEYSAIQNPDENGFEFVRYDDEPGEEAGAGEARAEQLFGTNSKTREAILTELGLNTREALKNMSADDYRALLERVEKIESDVADIETSNSDAANWWNGLSVSERMIAKSGQLSRFGSEASRALAYLMDLVDKGVFDKMPDNIDFDPNSDGFETSKAAQGEFDSATEIENAGQYVTRVEFSSDEIKALVDDKLGSNPEIASEQLDKTTKAVSVWNAASEADRLRLLTGNYDRAAVQGTELYNAFIELGPGSGLVGRVEDVRETSKRALRLAADVRERNVEEGASSDELVNAGPNGDSMSENPAAGETTAA